MALLKKKTAPTPEQQENTLTAVPRHLQQGLLPLDPLAGMPLPPKAQPGYYPGYDTLSQRSFWDEATRDLILARVHNIPPIRFFSPTEAQHLAAVVQRILPQDDRDEAHQIPIVPFIDERLSTGRINGYRYEGMPPDEDAYKLGLQGIDAIAKHLYARSFVDLEPVRQDQVLLTLHDDNPPAGQSIWQKMSVRHFWVLLLHDVIQVYYAHPYAWNEIGYGGPAYPRGYMRLEKGRPEPWEVEEKPYDWVVPPTALSGEAAREGEHGFAEPIPGQSGTH